MKNKIKILDLQLKNLNLQQNDNYCNDKKIFQILKQKEKDFNLKVIEWNNERKELFNQIYENQNYEKEIFKRKNSGNKVKSRNNSINNKEMIKS